MTAPTHIRLRRSLRAGAVPLVAAAVLAAVLVICLSAQTAYPQAPAAADNPAAPVAVATPDCSDPPAGQRARLVAEDELAAAYRGANDPRLRATEANNNGLGLDLINGWSSTTDALSEITMPAVTVADLQGDGTRESVMAFRDKNKALSVVTNRGAPAWYRNTGHDLGALQWIDIAAGNIDATTKGDEVVVALSNDTNDIDVIVLSGNSSGNIAQAANNELARYTDADGPEGSAAYVSVATGDLDLDGVDEIVTSFKDGNGDLHVIILEYGAGSLTVALNKSWTNYDRGHVADGCAGYVNHDPMDVATGDFDGDWADEIVFGFRSGKCEITGDVQMLVLKRNDDGSYDDRVFMIMPTGPSGTQSAATSVAVDGADVDGDGVDEIALFYNRVYSGNDSSDLYAWQQYLYAWEYVPPYAPSWSDCSKDSGNMMTCFCHDEGGNPRACIQERPGQSSWAYPLTKINFGESTDRREADVALASGDIDADGKEEIATGRYWRPGGSRIIETWDAENGLGISDRQNHRAGQRGSAWRSSASLGATSTTTAGGASTRAPVGSRKRPRSPRCCIPRRTGRTSTTRTPRPATPQTWAMARGRAQGGKSTWGGSFKIGGELPLPEIEGVLLPTFSPSYTREFETGMAVEGQQITTTLEGTKFATFPIWLWREKGYYDALQIVDTKYWCYDYREEVDVGLGTMPLCLPRPKDEQVVYSYPLSWWYTTGHENYPNSWVPVGINMARGRPATQSSVFEGAGAGRAVDGNTNGDYYSPDQSVARTTRQANAWWQLDLRGSQWIDAVLLWNRTDGAPDVPAQLTDYWVFVSDNPFLDTDTPSSLEPRIASGDVWASHEESQAGRPSVVAVNGHGRYVRVQLAGANTLSLAEFEVYGRPWSVDQWPTARPATTANSLKLTWPGDLEQVVSGKLMYARQGAQLGVTELSGQADFDLGIDTEGEQVTEYSTGQSWALGLETAFFEVESKTGTESTSGYILSWQKSIEFSGSVAGWQECVVGARPYTYMPYVWLQQARPRGGTDQAYLVLDYWVPQIDAPIAECDEEPPQGSGVAPLPPVISSPTHPDPGAWNAASAATLTWNQPTGDLTVVDGYAWLMDRSPTTQVPPRTAEMATTASFPELAVGDWYFHLAARSSDGKWSETAHRLVRVDATPPVVTLAVDPRAPDGNSDWYVSPVTVAASAADDGGSGVAAVEISKDGVAWQPYIADLKFSADTKGTTIWVRARDAVGNLSQAVSTSFKIDRTPPNSQVSGGSGPGTWVSGVYTNSVGNGVLALAGAIADSGSGRTGMRIRVDEANWASAAQVGVWHPFPDKPAVEVNWQYTATQEIGAGYHIFYGQSQDEAGNLETPYEIGRVTWFPEATPDLHGSTMVASPAIVRPGENLTFTLTVRNAGFQEALAGVQDALPPGMAPVSVSLPADVIYDPAANTADLAASTPVAG